MPADKPLSHSPGPWNFDGSHVLDASGKVVVIEGIAQPRSVTPKDDPAWANARLIAEAPELLSLVQRYLRYHDGVTRCESAEERQECLCSICQDARSITAEAEGRP